MGAWKQPGVCLWPMQLSYNLVTLAKRMSERGTTVAATATGGRDRNEGMVKCTLESNKKTAKTFMRKAYAI